MVCRKAVIRIVALLQFFRDISVQTLTLQVTLP
jgi:hypothetical protein